MNRVGMSGGQFECTVKPYPWPLGVGVNIDVTKSGERVGSVYVVCASDQAAFSALASLASSELCVLALSRFVAGDLPATLERVLWWQEEIGKLGFDCVSPLISAFQRT
jgi:hypothetical protein